MTKTSLLEVNFDNLAWKPVDPRIAKRLTGSLVPLEMARGKSEVYIKTGFDDSDATKLNEIKNFKNILETLDEKTNNKYDYVNNFMSFASSSYFKDKEENPSEVKEEPEEDKVEEIPEDEPKNLEDVLDDILNISDEDLELIKNGPSDEDENIIDQFLEPQSSDNEYKFYVINLEEKVIDSGWNDEQAAKDRLISIKENDAEGYSIEKYSTKLFKAIGDPKYTEFHPFGLKAFYVINSERNYVDSVFDDVESANQRLSEIEALVDGFNGDSEEPILEDSFEVLDGEKALDRLGLSVTYKGTFRPIEKIIKELEKIATDTLMESILVEADVSPSLGYFYTIFGFDKGFDPEDDSMRVGTSEEYSELEIYISKLVSADGEVSISSKDLVKTIDKLKRKTPSIKKPYQSLVKMINHSATYFYTQLGFGSKDEILSDEGYDPKASEVDTNPSAQISNDYINAIDNAEDESDDIVDYIKGLSRNIKKIKDAPDEELSKEQIDDNASYEKKLMSFASNIFSGDKLNIVLHELKETIIPFLNSLPNPESLYSQIVNDFEEYSKDMITKKTSGEGHKFNTPVSRGISTKDTPFKGTLFKTNKEYKELKDMFNAVSDEHAEELKGVYGSTKYNKVLEFFKQKYGFDFKEKLKELNKNKESELSSQGF